VAIAGSDLAAHIRRQADEATRREIMMAQLYAFSRRLAGIADPDELFRAIVEHLRAALRADIVLLLPTDGGLMMAAGSGGDFLPADHIAAESLWTARRASRQTALCPWAGGFARCARAGRMWRCWPPATALGAQSICGLPRFAARSGRRGDRADAAGARL